MGAGFSHHLLSCPAAAPVPGPPSQASFCVVAHDDQKGPRTGLVSLKAQIEAAASEGSLLLLSCGLNQHPDLILLEF